MKHLSNLKFVFTFFIVLQLAATAFTYGQHTKRKPAGTNPLYYWEYLPPGYSTAAANSLPMIIFLHGYGERSDYESGETDRLNQLSRVLKNGPPYEISKGKNMCFTVNGVSQCFIVLSPQITDNTTWQASTATIAKFVTYALATYPKASRSKIYITGLSMGGLGTIKYTQSAYTDSEKIAAIAVAPGGGGHNSEVCTDLNKRDIAVWAVHGKNDKTTQTLWEPMDAWIKAINACTTYPASPKAYFYLIPDAGHNVWAKFYNTTNTFYNPNVYQWFLRNPKGASSTTANQGPNLKMFIWDPALAKYKPITTESLVSSTLTVEVNSTSAKIKGRSADYDGAMTLQANSTIWSKVSGPFVTFTPSGTNTDKILDISGMTYGSDYTFKLQSKDSEGKLNSRNLIVKCRASATNTAPIASAGADKSFSLPTNSVNLIGTGSDPDGTIATYSWAQDSTDENPAVIASANSSITNINELVPGTYNFALTVTDNGGARSFDHVLVDVGSDVYGDNSFLEFTSNSASGKRVELYAGAPPDNGVQELVRTGGNDYLQFYLKQLSGTPNLGSLQIGLTVSYQNKYVNVLNTYIKETDEDGWTRIEIPLADFLHDPDRWLMGGVSNVGFKIVSNFGTGNIVFGVDEIQFTGGSTPFLWYGDEDETYASDDYVYTLDTLSFAITNHHIVGGVDDVLPPGGGWLKMTSETSASGKRIELYRDSTRSNNAQEDVRATGNDYLQYYFKVLQGTPAWANFQIGLTVSYQNKYVNVLSGYIKETNADGWTRVQIPLADFLHDPAKWTSGGVSNVGFKIVENFGTGKIVVGIDEVHFTGGTTPFVWYGDPRELSGTSECVYTLDPVEFYISDRPTQGGVLPDDGGGSFSMMASDDQGPQPEEPTEVFFVSVYDGNGQYIDSFEHKAKASDLANADFTLFVNRKGMLMFRIVNKDGQVTSEKIVYKN